MIEENEPIIIKSRIKEVKLLNEKVIILAEQPDGNWKGWINKDGKIISKRQYDPQIVLQLLITDDGK